MQTPVVVPVGAMSEVEFIDPPRTTREAFPDRTAGCDPRVPYALMSECVQLAWEMFPAAANVVGLWTPNGSSEVAAEVQQHEGRARVYSLGSLLEIARA